MDTVTLSDAKARLARLLADVVELSLAVPPPRINGARSRSHGLRLASAIAFLAALSSPAWPRQQPATSDRIDVVLVEVDVLVNDRKGRPILDLQRDDFELRVDGAPVDVTNFAAPRRDERSASVPGPETSRIVSPDASRAGDGRSQTGAAATGVFPPIVVLVDEGRLRASARQRSLRQLREWAGRADGSRRWMLVRLDTQVRPGTGFKANWLSNEQMAEAVEALGRELGAGEVGRSLERENLIERVEERGLCSDQALALVESYHSVIVGETASAMLAIADLASTLGTLPGRKLLVYLGEGLPLRPADDFFQVMAQECPSRRPLATQAASSGLDRQMAALSSVANANRVTIHMLEATGLRTLSTSSININPLAPAPGDQQQSGRATPGANFSAGELSQGGSVRGLRSPQFDDLHRHMLEDSLVGLAELTGGLTFLHANNLNPAFERIDREGGAYYSLGFPFDGAADSRPHRIELRLLGRPGELSYRRSFALLPQEARVESRLRATLAGAWSENGLGIDATLSLQSSLDQGTSSYILDIRWPAAAPLSFADASTDSTAEIDLFLLSKTDRRTSEMQHLRQSVPVQPGKTIALRVPLVLREEPGRVVAVGIVDRGSGISSFVAIRSESAGEE